MWLPCIIPLPPVCEGVGMRLQCLVLACVLVYYWPCPHLSGLSSLMETEGVESSSRGPENVTRPGFNVHGK